ncbi:NAD-dependent epimerase/dehydratase - like 1, partial [Theobroma cacao]
FYQESMGSTEKRVYICLFFYVAMSITNAFTRVHHHNGITTYAPLHRTSAQNHLTVPLLQPCGIVNFVAPTSSLMLSSVLFFGQNEVIKPTVDGALSILKSCANAKTVERLVFVSSGGTVAMQERKLVQYDETCWSDVDFIRAKKMTGWMYFASKTLAEKAAWGAAQENDIDFISVIPTLVVGPFIIPSMPPSLITALSLITRNEGHYSIIKQCQFRGVEEHLEVISFSSKTLTDLGFQFKYGFENMYTVAIETCIEKGLIPRCLNDNDHAAVGKIHNIMVLDVGFTSVAINLLPVCLKEA